eukprot:160925-Amphidinium_carterae.1
MRAKCRVGTKRPAGIWHCACFVRIAVLAQTTVLQDTVFIGNVGSTSTGTLIGNTLELPA